MVLPYFKKVERDIDFDGPLHGTEGRIPVRRVFPENWSDYAKAMAEAFKLAGYSYLPDQNGEFQDGYYPLAMSNLYDRRVSAAVGYLGATVRQRNNLNVHTEVQVSGLVFEDTRCVGVRAVVGHETLEFRANEVILCCGAIHSPAMLLRAGIGPVGHLRDLKPDARKNPYSKRSLHLGMRFSSGVDGAPPGDMALTVSNKSAWHAIGDRIAVTTLWVNKTFSEAGQVRLSSADWRQEPIVDFNLLSDHRDLVRLAKGFREIAALHELPPLKAVTSDAFPASFTDKIRKVSTYNTKNRILTSIGATLMDGPSFLRRAIIRRFIMESAGLVHALKDDEALETYIKRATVGVWHCSCSCRMGADDDPMAVTDHQGRVRGVHGLRVVDASIFPVVPCANTNFPTMMAAEKIADDIRGAEAVGAVGVSGRSRVRGA
jgi:5-(hydroxymethyl)furfural/furfural oxidase